MKVNYLTGRCYSSIGGIQSLNQQLFPILAIAGYLSRAVVRFDNHSDIPANLQGMVDACGGATIRFLFCAFKQRILGGGKLWLCDHLNYGPLAMSLSGGRYVIYTHAYELELPISPLRRVALKRAQRVICISEYCVKLVKKLGVSESQIKLLPHGQDFPVQPPSKPRLSSVPRILFVGRLDRHYKGQDHLLEAAVLLKQCGIRFTLRYCGGGSMLDSFRNLASTLGVSDCVEFLGFVSDDDLSKEFADADMFAMPSNGEGFGLVYLQAMANGLPCICADGDAAKEVVIDEETGIVVPYANPEKLADALERLISNAELRAEMGRAGEKRYLKYFTEEAFKERFFCFLKELEV